MSHEIFALLGLGAPGRAFRDKSFELPGGCIGWIRWMDRDWITGDSRPALAFDVPPDEPLDPFAEDLTDEWLDRCPDAGRFVFLIEDASAWASRQEAANATADVVAGLLAFAVPLSQAFSAVRLEADWVERGRVLLQDVQERDADFVPALRLLPSCARLAERSPTAPSSTAACS